MTKKRGMGDFEWDTDCNFMTRYLLSLNISLHYFSCLFHHNQHPHHCTFNIDSRMPIWDDEIYSDGELKKPSHDLKQIKVAFKDMQKQTKTLSPLLEPEC
jgi:hypothetical protein